MMALLLAAALARAGPVTLGAGAVDPEATGTLFRGRRVALVVGPEGFDDGGFAPLRYPCEDAEAVADALRDPARGHFDAVEVLTARGETDLAEVRAALGRLASEALSPDDTVFVYFSTHGTLAREPAGHLGQYLVLSDTRLADVRRTGLPHDEVLDWLERLPSRRKVLVLATCHSGQGKSAFSEDVARELAGLKGPPLPPLRDVSEAVVILGACAWNETARESDALGHDIYTWFLLEALDAGDLDGDGAVTVTEAHDHARQATWAYTDGAQRPYARAEILGTDPVVLAGERSREGLFTLATYRAAWDGYAVRVDGQDKGTLPGQVAVEPGRHRVEVWAPEGHHLVARQRVRTREGGRLDVDRLLRRDRARIAVGLAWEQYALPVPSGPTGAAEIHLPRLLPRSWEVVLSGSAAPRWPSPTLQGGAAVERVLLPGTVQVRGGLGLRGYLLGAPGADGEPGLLAPGLVPEPVVSVAWLPLDPVVARLALSGGYAWYTDGGDWHHGFRAGLSLVAGGAF